MAKTIIIVVWIVWWVWLALAVTSFIRTYLIRKRLGISQRSENFCFSCKNKLRWTETIPIISWIALGGKCKYCKTKIPLL